MQHGGPTPEYLGDFIDRMEAIHAEAKANLAPLVNITGEYIIDALEAFKNLTEAAVSSKKARYMVKDAQVDWAAKIDEIVSAANAKADAILANAESKMTSLSTSWEGKHARYNVEASIEELKVSFQDTMDEFLGYFKHSKTGRRLAGLAKNHTMTFEDAKADIESLISSWTPVWDKKSPFTHSGSPSLKFDFAGHGDTKKADLDAKKAEISAKFADAKAKLNKPFTKN